MIIIIHLAVQHSQYVQLPVLLRAPLTRCCIAQAVAVGGRVPVVSAVELRVRARIPLIQARHKKRYAKERAAKGVQHH